jgi:hypothetical protein
MSVLGNCVLLTCGISGACWAAHCTTVASPGILREYDNYVAAVEQSMERRFDSGELAWAPPQISKQAAARLASGLIVRGNLSDAALNQRIAGQNGTVIDWIGAIRIHNVSVADVKSVLEDYDSYVRIYRPMIFECKAVRDGADPHVGYDVILGLHNEFRLAALFPQHYAFQTKARIDYSSGSALRVHLGASEIRESDSGVPGRTDFLEPQHDHGIMWALNAYWRASQQGKDVYLEFETITLARSVQEFVCKIGFVPVPKSIVSAAMDFLPPDCITVIVEGTRAECERRTNLKPSSQ